MNLRRTLRYCSNGAGGRVSEGWVCILGAETRGAGSRQGLPHLRSGLALQLRSGEHWARSLLLLPRVVVSSPSLITDHSPHQERKKAQWHLTWHHTWGWGCVQLLPTFRGAAPRQDLQPKGPSAGPRVQVVLGGGDASALTWYQNDWILRSQGPGLCTSCSAQKWIARRRAYSTVSTRVPRTAGPKMSVCAR